MENRCRVAPREYHEKTGRLVRKDKIYTDEEKKEQKRLTTVAWRLENPKSGQTGLSVGLSTYRRKNRRKTGELPRSGQQDKRTFQFKVVNTCQVQLEVTQSHWSVPL